MSQRSRWTGANQTYYAYLVGTSGAVFESGPNVYPSVDLAIESLQWVADQSLAVIGFDGFIVEGESLQPSLDHISDFSGLLEGSGTWGVRVGESIRVAREVLLQWRGQVSFVEMVIVAEDDIAPPG